MTKEPGLVYIGKIVQLEAIPNADLIISATVLCGNGGKWRGVVRKDELSLGWKCLVFLPDSLLPQVDEYRFMESRGWRVKMCRFRGAPSEVLIMPINFCSQFMNVGDDVTEQYGVTKYFKPVPPNLQGLAKGDFPQFIPKTDELNYQRHFDLVEALHGKGYYVTEKADGSSTTAYRYKGQFGVCSRNYELLQDENNGYWKIAAKYQLEAKLPDNIALQWETCGPKIQSNPMGLTELDGFAFSAYNIEEKRYLVIDEFLELCDQLQFPTVRLIESGSSFDKDIIDTLGEGRYRNGKEREGVVVRSHGNYLGTTPISFKVINLNYEK